MFLFLSHNYLGVEMADHMVSIYLNLHDTAKEFSYSYQPCKRVPVVLHPWQYLVFTVFLVFAILVSMKWHDMVVFIFTSMETNKVN